MKTQQALQAAREAAVDGRDWAEDTLKDYDEKYDRHPSTEGGRKIITDSIDRINAAIALIDEALAEVQEPVAWMDLHNELGQFRWTGKDRGWNMAIEAVQNRLVELDAAHPAPAQPAQEKCDVRFNGKLRRTDGAYVVDCPACNGTGTRPAQQDHLPDGGNMVAVVNQQLTTDAKLLEACKAFSDYVHSEQCATDGAVTYSTSTINHHAFSIRAAIAQAEKGQV